MMHYFNSLQGIFFDKQKVFYFNAVKFIIQLICFVSSHRIKSSLDTVDYHLYEKWAEKKI